MPVTYFPISWTLRSQTPGNFSGYRYLYVVNVILTCKGDVVKCRADRSTIDRSFLLVCLEHLQGHGIDKTAALVLRTRDARGAIL